MFDFKFKKFEKIKLINLKIIVVSKYLYIRNMRQSFHFFLILFIIIF